MINNQINRFFNSTVPVNKLGTTRTSFGSTAKGYTERIASLRCRVDAEKISEITEQGKLAVSQVWKLYCAATSTNLAITETDRITLDSRTLEVTGINNPGLLNRHLEIELEEVV